ncbi:DUF4275 family protein [Roseateles chitinivorans]|uniref:DUF4275 family protein n=1 Tax=Roseateles chitinivorans TaxID=2917965 RepID=UPI003D66CAD2
MIPRMAKQETPLITPGRILRELSEVEAAALAASWLDAFARGVRAMNLKAYLWHVFSGGGYESLSGKEALVAYATREAPEYIVLSNDRKTAFVTDQRPDWTYMGDWYVFPSNFAWTMAFTHEDGWLGPYFATHRDGERLHAANLAQIRKRREVEEARAKGWT